MKLQLPHNHRLQTGTTILLIILLGTIACKRTETKTMEVTATAYNSLPAQTHPDHFNITAWGDTLREGMRAIAVSRDLIPLGLDHNAAVSIEGLPGTYLVLDKMNKRWKKKIDIYMGTDREAALQWGKQTVTISWEIPK
ncbi:MAG: hypothetical protein R2824_26780 [Saprospiraceae bacterium]|nr:3D domain-containing protein [Lewinella sp.]